MSYCIRRLSKRRGEFQEAERLSRLVWGPASTELTHVLIAAVEAGGLVLGAIAPDGTLAGFCMAFPAFRAGHAWLHSHSMAVHPDHRQQGIARALKLRQREEALSMGLDLIRWTYDPLRTINAHLNLRRLGAKVLAYAEEYYGPMQDKLNAALPSDRVFCHWELESTGVVQRLRGTYRPPQIPGSILSFDATGHLQPVRPVPASSHNKLFLPVPTDIDTLLKSDPERALEWRLIVRKHMEDLFDRGFIGTDFCTVQRHAQRVGIYIFERGVSM